MFLKEHKIIIRLTSAVLALGTAALTLSGCGVISEVKKEISNVISEEFHSSESNPASSKESDTKQGSQTASYDQAQPGASYTMADIAKLQNVDYFGEGTLEHIFDGTINRKGKATGYHYTMVMDSKGEIVEGTRTAPDKNGVFTAKVRVSGVDKNGFSSFYPESWTPQQVVDAINVAYKDAMTNPSNPNNQLWIGHYGDLEIDMYLDDERLITTAFPVYQGDKT